MSSAARKRTWIGICLFVPLAALLLVTFACLPAPVGDPETASVDEALTGAWKLAAPNGNGETGIALVRPWDKHTYFVQYFMTSAKNGEKKVMVVDHKAWLTTIAGKTFISCESLNDLDYVSGTASSDHYYWVAKVEHVGNTVTLTPLNENGALLKDVKTREAIEDVVKENVDNKELYSDSQTYMKLDKDQIGEVKEMQKLARVGLNSGDDAK